jgi:hypothetical protein
MKANRLGRYLDVKEVLDQALASGGGVYTLTTHGDAVRWRQRAYEFRKAYAEAMGTSPYDVLTMPRIPSESCDVVMSILRPRGIFRPASAAPAPTALDAAAAELVAKIEKGDVL